MTARDVSVSTLWAVIDLPYSNGSRCATESSMITARDHSARPIVILGGGFAGAYCARALEKRLGRSEADICLIDRNNYFVFYPLLIKAVSAKLQ